MPTAGLGLRFFRSAPRFLAPPCFFSALQVSPLLFSPRLLHSTSPTSSLCIYCLAFVYKVASSAIKIELYVKFFKTKAQETETAFQALWPSFAVKYLGVAADCGDGEVRRRGFPQERLSIGSGAGKSRIIHLFYEETT